MKSSNQTATKVTRGLVAYLKKTGQLNILPQLVRETLKKSQLELDPQLAIVTTAVKLTAAQTKELKATLSGAAGYKVRLKTKVDPAIIGGVHIRLGDKVIDRTIRSNIHQLGERLHQ